MPNGRGLEVVGDVHWGNLSPEEIEVSDNAPAWLSPQPAHPFTDPPPGDDGQPVIGTFIGREWYCMWGAPLASTVVRIEGQPHVYISARHAVPIGEADPDEPADIWVELHGRLRLAKQYISGGNNSYVSLWRQLPSPDLRRRLARRKPWSAHTAKTLQGYRGRLNTAHIRGEALQAQWLRWAPDLGYLRRHGPYPHEYLWATLWPQPLT